MDELHNTLPSEEEQWAAIERTQREMTPPPGFPNFGMILWAGFALESLLIRDIIPYEHALEMKPKSFWDRFKNREVGKTFDEAEAHVENCERCRTRLQAMVDEIQRVLRPQK